MARADARCSGWSWRRAILALTLATPTQAKVLQVTILQRMSDASISTEAACAASGGDFSSGTCWLAGLWKTVMAAGLAAVSDFNARNAMYSPNVAGAVGCDIQLTVQVIDTGSTAPTAMGRLTDSLCTDANRTNVVVGPAGSTVSEATATLLGNLDITQVAYWPTSPSLSSEAAFPRFMRTSPSDESTASKVCAVVNQLGFSGMTVARPVLSAPKPATTSPPACL